MRKILWFLVLASASPLFAGCSTTDQRLSGLEGQMQNVQVLDLRMSNAEDRLTKVEGELSGMRSAPPPAKAGTGKKGAGKTDEKNYALQTPPATGKTPAPAPQAAAISPQPAPVPQAATASPQPISGPAPTPTPAPILGVPQPPYASTYTDGRRVEPKGAPTAVPVVAASPTPAPTPATESPAPGKAPAPALIPVGLGESSPAAPKAVPPKAAAPTKPAKPVAEEKAPAASEKTGSGAYDAALALYYKGLYSKAQEQFDGFLRGNPSSSLAPNAMYWQGECLYSQNKFDSAIIIFKDLAGKYPKHPKAAAALLKAGFAYARIKDMENARFYWQILVDDFPKSEPATIARKRLAQG